MKKIFQALRMSELDSVIEKTSAKVPGAAVKASEQPSRGESAACASPVAASQATAPNAAPYTPGKCRGPKRAKLGIPALLRPAEPEDGSFEETLMTQNVSKTGLYLGNAKQAYREGMRLFVTFPSVANEPSLSGEYDARVVRVERPDGSTASIGTSTPAGAPANIAVHLVSTRTV
jgi:hypothetical protein